MKKMRIIITLTVLLALLAFAQSASAAVTVGDGSFELGPANPYWTQSSTKGYQLIVSGGAHTGTYRAWLGADGGNGEVSVISQDIKLPKKGWAYIAFYLKIADYDPAGGDKLQVIVDGVKLHTWQETAAGFASYHEVAVSLEDFLDGGVHTLTIKGTDKVGGNTSWYIDDVYIEFNAIEDGSLEVDTDGDKVPDSWKISSPSGKTKQVYFPYLGAFSVRLQGNTGSQEKLIYVYKAGPTGRAGDTFELSLYGNCSGFTAIGQWGITVEAYNTDGTVSTLHTGGYVPDTGGMWLTGGPYVLTAPKDYKKIKLTIWHLGNSPGVAYVDYFFMWATGGPVPAPALPDGPTLEGE
jgi:hypothetical protein